MKNTFVGLGNIGIKYQNTRHNVGFMFVDWYSAKLGGSLSDFKLNKRLISEILEIEDHVFVKPQTMMNNSGDAVSRYLNFYKPNSTHKLYIVHDDLDIKLGDFKIVKGKGPKVHNGVNSIEDKLGRTDFERIRIGVENRGNKKISGEDYVLQNFTENEISVLKSVFADIYNKFT